MAEKGKASQLNGIDIYQDEQHNRTIYSNIFMKDYGYIITNDKADSYYSYSIRWFEALFGAALILVIYKDRYLLALGLGIAIYAVLSLFFYFKLLKKCSRVEFKKPKKDNYIVTTSSEQSIGRLLLIIAISAVLGLMMTYKLSQWNLEGFLLVGFIGLIVLVFSFVLLNIATLFYKLFKK